MITYVQFCMASCAVARTKRAVTKRSLEFWNNESSYDLKRNSYYLQASVEMNVKKFANFAVGVSSKMNNNNMNNMNMCQSLLQTTIVVHDYAK